MKRVLFVIAGAALLTACENAKESLGLETKPPDEFAVVKRAPLEMPPDYYLRPPAPGQQRPQELRTDQEAKQAVFGAEAVQVQEQRPVSTGENILLQKTGATNIDPDIRRKVDAETAEIAEENIPGIDKIRGLVGQKVDTPATVVNAKEEAQRLKDNERSGLPANEGDVPTVDR